MAQGSRAINRKDSAITTRCDRVKRALGRWKRGINATVVLSVGIHVAKIVIGALYINDCPVDQKIPIFLIVAGAVGIISRIITLSRDFLLKYSRVESVIGFIGTFEFVWYICGCVWIFRVLTPSYDPISGNQYCHKTLYVFALVIISIVLAVIGLAILGVLLIAFCTCCCVGVLNMMFPDDEDVERTGNQLDSH